MAMTDWTEVSPVTHDYLCIMWFVSNDLVWC